MVCQNYAACMGLLCVSGPPVAVLDSRTLRSCHQQSLEKKRKEGHSSSCSHVTIVWCLLLRFLAAMQFAVLWVLEVKKEILHHSINGLLLRKDSDVKRRQACRFQVKYQIPRSPVTYISSYCSCAPISVNVT